MSIKISHKILVIKKSLYLFVCCTIFCSLSQAQPKDLPPLDHTVYDGWQEIGAKKISNNGEWIAYTIKPQEGNEQLVIYNISEKGKLKFSRSSDPTFTADNKFVVFRIHPPFKHEKEEEPGKKNKSNKSGKDTLAILSLADNSLIKMPRLISFQVPERDSGWIVFRIKNSSTGKTAGDSLCVYNLSNGSKFFFGNVEDYRMSDRGNYVALSVKNPEKKNQHNSWVVLWHDALHQKTDTLNTGAASFEHFVFDSIGGHLAWLCHHKSPEIKEKLFSLYYFKTGDKHGKKIVEDQIDTRAYPQTINNSSKIFFSKNGDRLFFSTIPTHKNDTLGKDGNVKLDIWRYNDNYLFTRQQKLDEDSSRGFKAMVDLRSGRLVQLADKGIPVVFLPDNNEAGFALGVTDSGYQISSQWQPSTLNTAYLISLKDGSRKKIVDTVRSDFFISPNGKFVTWYNGDDKSWLAYNALSGETKNITQAIPDSFYDVEFDRPESPPPYGIAGWTEQDNSILLNAQYDIWQVDLNGKKNALNITNGYGRDKRLVFRVAEKEKKEPIFSTGDTMILKAFNEANKNKGFYRAQIGKAANPTELSSGPFHYSSPVKAKNKPVYIFTKESFIHSPDLYVGNLVNGTRISNLNPQQALYNWGTDSLIKWKTFDGKSAEGILYKPENFDSSKHYPMIVYFYEIMSDRLNNYIPPAPTPSRLNISFFVSRGYLVFVPDIHYTIGHPGQSAYNYIISGVRSLLNHSWVDSTRLGIQGQSWGGYQTVYLITQTPLFKAAWAGAPVVNMFSAYGGIRWGTGVSRGFQYEHGQSRIGATIWERPDLYIENSPLFFLPKVQTPLVIMANDHDEKVPWYQGIELFTDLRRLGKEVWMLNYRGEKHNLVQRKNRKDISMKEQQFFDHFLKGAPLPGWMESESGYDLESSASETSDEH